MGYERIYSGDFDVGCVGIHPAGYLCRYDIWRVYTPETSATSAMGAARATATTATIAIQAMLLHAEVRQKPATTRELHQASADPSTTEGAVKHYRWHSLSAFDRTNTMNSHAVVNSRSGVISNEPAGSSI
ncbi:hypothetical protein [Serratia ficaria]|uniref:hypothetical protein n=1 Tax=Serratia ficaria TaxID=61651 RepID=UPI0021C91B42|nr:hypothetical protein [Serratia ficaria]